MGTPQGKQSGRAEVAQINLSHPVALSAVGARLPPPTLSPAKVRSSAVQAHWAVLIFSDGFLLQEQVFSRAQPLVVQPGNARGLTSG